MHTEYQGIFFRLEQVCTFVTVTHSLNIQHSTHENKEVYKLIETVNIAARLFLVLLLYTTCVQQGIGFFHLSRMTRTDDSLAAAS